MGILEEFESTPLPSATDVGHALPFPAALRARQAELFAALSRVVDEAEPSRVEGWLRRLGLVTSAAGAHVVDDLVAGRELIERALASEKLASAPESVARELRAKLNVALSRLTFINTSKLGVLIRDGSLQPMEALRLVGDNAVELDLQSAHALATGIVGALRNAQPRARLELAESLRLPLSARWLGKGAAPLLRLLVEDEALRPFFADGAARLWLELDLHDALPAALGVADDVNNMTLLALAATVDREEAFEFLSARFARDSFFCELLSRTGRPLLADEDRWVPLAMSRLEAEPEAALRMLGFIGTQRAADELAGIAEHAEGLDDVALAAVVTAARLRKVSGGTLARILQKPGAWQLLESPAHDVVEVVYAERAAIEAALEEEARTMPVETSARARALLDELVRVRLARAPDEQP